jgi:hypothetical protein
LKSICKEVQQSTFNMHLTNFIGMASASLLFLPAIIASPITSPLGPAELARRGQMLARNNPGHELTFEDDDDHQVLTELEKTFSVLEEIPDEILEAGDEATDKWMIEHNHRQAHDKSDLSGRDLVDRGAYEIARCAAAIAAFIASNSIAAAKLLRIKKYIRALGGVRTAAELLLKATTAAERLQYGGEALALLAGEFFGTSLITNNC